MNSRFALATFTALLLAGLTPGATWYVNNAEGSNDNNGKSIQTPKQTIAAAMAQAGESDTLVLANTGIPYRETIKLARFGGTPTKPFTIVGNGAVLTGLRVVTKEQWEKQNDGSWLFKKGRHGSLRPYLVENGKAVPRAKNRKSLTPGTHYWAPEGVYFMPAQGKTIDDHHIEATVATAGLAVRDASYIHCTDLVCEYFSNDGFNIHGSCQGLRFERIEARFNGDDGFSVHEDVGSVVYDGYFHHNNYGIQDVNASRSEYYGVVAEHNAYAGVHFNGGMHALVASTVRDNPRTQIRVTPNKVAHLGMTDDSPIARGMTFFRDVVVSGGSTGFEINSGATAIVTNCLITGSATGVKVEKGGSLRMILSVVAGTKTTEMDIASKTVRFYANRYHPGRIVWQGQRFEPQQFDAYRKASGQDDQSEVKKPDHVGDGSMRLKGAPTAPGTRLPVGLSHPAWKLR